MLEFNVSQLLLAPQGARRQFAFDEEAAALREPSIVGRVRGAVTFTRTQGILVDCQFDTTMALECGRCLEPAIVPVSGHFEEEFAVAFDVRTGAPLAAPPDAEAFTIDANHYLDLGEAIRQNVLMAAPLQPLCRSDCRGLCIRCGQNLNEGACACEPSQADSPFAALQQLLEPTEEPTPPA
ncbi:MAG TPA: YceD family protein [Chloroflexota bacterium]|nr:YceD family protein [Chloroflexota bacterium]